MCVDISFAPIGMVEMVNGEREWTFCVYCVAGIHVRRRHQAVARVSSGSRAAARMN